MKCRKKIRQLDQGDLAAKAGRNQANSQGEELIAV
jgi:hypothetical protein